MSLQPGPRASVTDLRRAQDRYDMMQAELPRIRAASTAWRNGLAALLAAVVSFGLIKGRSDVSQLASPWAMIVGLLLLAALLAGAVGALYLLRAANGSPSVTSARELPPRAIADHLEALASAKALWRGIRLTLLCTLLLVAAVATTWYGPSSAGQIIDVGTPSGHVCGTVVRLSNGLLTLRTKGGETTIALNQATTLAPGDSCQAA